METKILKLTSLDAEKYPDIKVECKMVNDIQAYAEAFITYQKERGVNVKTAKKTALVSARVGEIGEEVDTRPRVSRDDKIYVIGETKGKVKVEGSMIVKNPDGEEYIVKPDKFASKYKETETPGVYASTDKPIKYIELTEDICFMAPWGEMMFGLKGACLNVTNIAEGDVYAIQNEAFDKTYTDVLTSTKDEKTM